MTDEARNTAVEALREVCITDRIEYLDALQAWWKFGDVWAETHSNRDDAYAAINRVREAAEHQQESERAFRSLVHRDCHRDTDEGTQVIGIDVNTEEGQEILRRLFGGEE